VGTIKADEGRISFDLDVTRKKHLAERWNGIAGGLTQDFM
jgi:hypothetical protein